MGVTTGFRYWIGRYSGNYQHRSKLIVKMVVTSLTMLKTQFQFAGVVESGGRYPIYMDPVSLKDIFEECEKTIARHPTGPYSDIDDACLGGSEHSDQCM